MGNVGLFFPAPNRSRLWPFEITFVRVSISLLATAIPVVLFARELLYVRLRDLWCFLGTGVVSVLLFSVCYFKGLELTSLASGDSPSVYRAALCCTSKRVDIP